MTRPPAAFTEAETPFLLDVRDLRVGFLPPGGGRNMGIAVDGVSFSLSRGKTPCLVGESGCGKTVTALSLLRPLPSPPSLRLGGSIFFDGENLAALPEPALRAIRGNRPA